MLQLLCVKVAMKCAYFFPFIGSSVKHSYRMRKTQETNKFVCILFVRISRYTRERLEVHDLLPISS